MNRREQLAEEADDPELLFADGFDEAILGTVDRFGQETAVLYDRQKVLEILMRDKMTYEEAEEYFSFNIIGAWIGDRTPAFAQLLENGN